ncbi:MAG: DUF2208 family protein [Sulfolobales archaeon]|nr:DUF2208 domain-containing protein [Sulfolobales archaeon]MCX8208122.1 DUF2208 domain-containing protein [Sulfolobales archaeon]MDW8010817.1 DUF2208 family protein [Sulfolobales archaeon]
MGRLSYYMTKKAMMRSAAISQGVIALFIVINIFVPPEYHGVVTALYFVIFMSLFMLMSMRHQKLGGDAKDIVSGRKILVVKQEEVVQIQSKDLELVKELKPLLKASGVSLLSMVVVMVWFFLVYPNLVQPYFTVDSGGISERVLELLILYEVPVATSLLTQIASRRLVKKYVNVLRSVEVYNTGIIGKPGFAVKFPVQGYVVRVCPSRKFLDFVKSEGGVEVLFRIYTDSVDRLTEVISKYGKTSVVKVT